MSLLPSRSDALLALVRHVRLLPVEAVGKSTMHKLISEELVTCRKLLVAVLPESPVPLATWSPGQPPIDLDVLLAANRARWSSSVMVLLMVLEATAKAYRVVLGKRKRARRARQSEVSHDLLLAIAWDSCPPEDRCTWVKEELAGGGSGSGYVPDALSHDGSQVEELFGSSYTRSDAEKIVNYCYEKGLCLRLW